MNSTFLEEGGFTTNHSQPERSAVKKSVRRLTARQIAEVSNSSLDGQDVSAVRLVAVVASRKQSNTGVSLRLFDTTGEIQCNFWPNGAHDEAAMNSIEENELVSICGTYRTFNERASVIVTSVSKADGSELIYHLTGCLYEKQVLLNKIAPETGSRKTRKSGAVDDAILKLVRENESSQGIHIDTIVAMLGSEYDTVEIKEGVERLCKNCHLYHVENGNYRSG
ncbi:RFA2A [Enterospora canceri]|uniref:RFA2A n=1 Tax=Enterospora canceri TaxID=1081671 RepID=A0A1Y1S7W8_9MICR|nr:RFA2A [Enterospora canceri]